MDLRISEIAERLGVPEASVRTIMRRARLNGVALPKPTKREGNARLYDYNEFLKFLTENFKPKNYHTLKIYDVAKKNRLNALKDS